MTTPTKNKSNKTRKKLNWKIVLRILFPILLFLIGIITGMLMGIDYTITKGAEAIGIITQGSTINVSIDLNETQIVDRTYEHLNPYLQEWNKTIMENKTK